jgi:hypothetical protein
MPRPPAIVSKDGKRSIVGGLRWPKPTVLEGRRGKNRSSLRKIERHQRRTVPPSRSLATCLQAMPTAKKRAHASEYFIECQCDRECLGDLQERPYNDDSTASRPLCEVKHRLARLVLRWGTTLESLVMFFCNYYKFLTMSSRDGFQ